MQVTGQRPPECCVPGQEGGGKREKRVFSCSLYLLCPGERGSVRQQGEAPVSQARGECGWELILLMRCQD